jgi:hypothetical protein
LRSARRNWHLSKSISAKYRAQDVPNWKAMRIEIVKTD